MAYDNTLQFYQGNSKTLFCSVIDSSGTQMDLTNYNGAFYAKKFPVKANATYDISIGHASKNAAQGAYTFDFTPTDTSLVVGDYVYEVLIIDTSNNKNITVIQDSLKIIDSIK